jgi:choline-glycine betaine transporter
VSPIFVGSCLLPLVIITAAASQPSTTPALLNRLGNFFMANFPHWIIWSIAFFLISCTVVSVVPSIGRRKLGVEHDKAQFSYFSWFSMIFGAGMGVGLLTWGVAEPIAGMQNNPDVIRGLTTAASSQNMSSALKWSYLHWGLGAWSSYSIVGLAVAYTGYRQGLPLTIRTALFPLFGNAMGGKLGHVVDVAAVAATLLCILQTLGYALDEFVICVARSAGAFWLLETDGSATVAGKIGASVFIMSMAAASAMSGTGRGIKWLSNVNMLFSFVILAVMLLAGSFKDGIYTLFISVFDYLINMPTMMFQVWMKDGTEIGDSLQDWQGTWSMFHWAWWLAFSPFVGVFLARISRGRTIRQYIFATIVLPAFLCMVWMAWAGGNAIVLELDGSASGALIRAGTGQKIFSLVQYLFEPWAAWIVSMVLLLLLTTYLTTTIDSAFIVTTTVLRQELYSHSNRRAVLVWSVILTVVLIMLILVDGFTSIRSAMVAAAIPISFLVTTLCISLAVAISKDKAPGSGPVASDERVFDFN